MTGTLILLASVASLEINHSINCCGSSYSGENILARGEDAIWVVLLFPASESLPALSPEMEFPALEVFVLGKVHLAPQPCSVTNLHDLVVLGNQAAQQGSRRWQRDPKKRD